MPRRSDVCAQCYGPKSPAHTRCDGCLQRQRDWHRALYEARKLAGQCIACGSTLDADAPTNTCTTCRERKNRAAAKSQARRLRAVPGLRDRLNEATREARRKRREAGRCQFCNKPADGARCEEHVAMAAADYQASKERGPRAQNAPGREFAVLLDFIVDAAPTHLEEPIPMKGLLARVLETYGSVSATVVGAERRMHRALVALVEEGRLVRVIGRGQVAGYRRPPRQVRQRVSALSSSQTVGGQARTSPSVNHRAAASQDAAVVNQDSHPG